MDFFNLGRAAVGAFLVYAIVCVLGGLAVLTLIFWAVLHFVFGAV